MNFNTFLLSIRSRFLLQIPLPKWSRNQTITSASSKIICFYNVPQLYKLWYSRDAPIATDTHDSTIAFFNWCYRQSFYLPYLFYSCKYLSSIKFNIKHFNKLYTITFFFVDNILVKSQATLYSPHSSMYSQFSCHISTEYIAQIIES